MPGEGGDTSRAGANVDVGDDDVADGGDDEDYVVDVTTAQGVWDPWPTQD